MATIANSRRRRFVTVMTAFLAVAIMSVAAAAWLATGSGTGQADAGQDQVLTIAVGEVTAEADVLYPNNSGNIRFVVSNPNPYNVDIEKVTFDDVVAADGDGTCTTHGVTFDDITDLDLVVGAGGSLAVQLVDAADMDNTSDDGCQNASFTAPVSITGASTAADASDDAF